MRLRDKVAIVTGGGKGIGLRYVRGFAAEGATVVVAEIDAEAAEHAASEVRASGGRAIEVHTDVSDEASVKSMAARVISAFGKIDVLINNAALFAEASDQRGPNENLTVDQWDRMFAVNVRGTWLCCKHVVPHMRERGGGSIINISSGTAWKGARAVLGAEPTGQYCSYQDGAPLALDAVSPLTYVFLKPGALPGCSWVR
jgi:3-oxoacyl-[acyl-carrier protein] reductase